MTEKIKQILVALATGIVIYTNFLAGTGRINNTTPGEISDKYPTAITPAGYAFSIWSLIYLGLIAFSIYQLLPSQKNNKLFAKIRPLYIANCAANCLWIFLWHYDFIGGSIVAMGFILWTLIGINSQFTEETTNYERWTTKVPFNLYFGWITAATILNATILLVYLGVEFTEPLVTFSACLLLASAAVLAFIVRRRLNIPVYALAIAWALAAIAVSQFSNSLVCGFAVTGAIAAVIFAFLPNRSFR